MTYKIDMWLKVHVDSFMICYNLLANFILIKRFFELKPKVVVSIQIVVVSISVFKIKFLKTCQIYCTDTVLDNTF